jgi:hypothetical protein
MGRPESAGHERCNLRIAFLDLLRRRQQLGEIARWLNAALLENVGSPVKDRPFDVDRQTCQLARKRRGLDQLLADVPEVVVRRGLLGDEIAQVRQPTGRRELLAFARGKRHEDIDLAALGIEDSEQPLAHLLLLVHIEFDCDSGALLELCNLRDQRLPQRVIVDQEVDGLPVVALPVVITGISALRR